MAKKTKIRIQKPDKGAYLPSRKEIRECCKAIRAEWSEKETLKRMGFLKAPEWTVPEVHVNAEITSEEGSRQDPSGAGGSDSYSDSI